MACSELKGTPLSIICEAGEIQAEIRKPKTKKIKGLASSTRNKTRVYIYKHGLSLRHAFHSLWHEDG